MADKENRLTVSPNLQAEVKKYFFYLFCDFGFEFINSTNDYQGNVLVAQSDKLRLRFIRDRADFFLDVGHSSRPDEWIAFYKLLEKFKQDGKIKGDYKISNKLQLVSNLLHNYFALIKEYFSEPS